MYAMRSDAPASAYASRIAGASSRLGHTRTEGPAIGSWAEPIRAARVSGEDQVALVAGHAREVGRDRAPGVRPVGADVRVVARPHHPVDADVRTAAHGEVVGDVRVQEVAVHVL